MIFEKVCGVPKEIDINVKAMIEQYRIVSRMTVNCSLGKWEA